MDYKEAKRILEDILKDKVDRKSDIPLLFSWATGKSREELLLGGVISDREYKKLLTATNKRKEGIPIQKIIGNSPFFGVEISYSSRTLTPRQETEQLVEMVIKEIGESLVTVLDMCCGSGCIGLAIAKHTKAKVTCSDICKFATNHTQKNAKLNNLQVQVVQSDMFENISGRFDIIVSNPPYIKSKDMEKLKEEVVKHDPKKALDGGEDGMDFYRVLANESIKFLNKNGKLFLEIDKDGGEYIQNILKSNFKCIKIIKDYSNLDRFIVATLKD